MINRDNRLFLGVGVDEVAKVAIPSLGQIANSKGVMQCLLAGSNPAAHS